MFSAFLPTFFPTLRSRLTIFYIISTVIVFTLLSGLFSGVMWLALHNQIDHHIHIVTTQAEHIINNFADDQQEVLLNNVVQVEGMSILVIDLNGTVLTQKYSQDMSPLQNEGIQQVVNAINTTGYHPLHFTIHGQRFGSAQVSVRGQPSLLVVGYSTKILQQTFFQMMGVTLGVITLMLPLLTYLGYRLLKKYLYPLEVVASTARQVTHPKKLSKRVTDLPLTSELSTIVTAFNEMLGRLEKIFETEHLFFSDAAHTLKTPLAVLFAKVEGLTKESDIKKREIIQVIDSAVDTVQDLLLISRIETGGEGSLQPVNLSQIVKELLELAESLGAEKKVHITSQIQNDLLIKADERLVKKALGNVVHNALEYVNHNGSVQMSVEKKQYQVVFRVTNTGTTLSKDELTHVFDRFYRGSNALSNTKGSGLGLAITKAIVESFQGKITVQISHHHQFVVVIHFPRL